MFAESPDTVWLRRKLPSLAFLVILTAFLPVRWLSVAMLAEPPPEKDQVSELREEVSILGSMSMLTDCVPVELLMSARLLAALVPLLTLYAVQSAP